MKSRSLTDYNRRDIRFFTSEVEKVLPAYFREDYPDLITFLEKYYDFVSRDEADSFTSMIHDLYQIRDLKQTDLVYLNSIFSEIGNGVTADYFQNPRDIGKLLARFFRVKGSLYSAEGFFRAFYGEEIDVVYPKRDLFVVGESEIGPESLKYIQNYSLYQIFSILIRSPIPISKWRSLYKKFVHPAGFYLAGEVIIEGIGNITANTPISIEDSDIVPSFVEVGSMTITGTSSITGIFADGADSDSYPERLSLNNTISQYQDLTITELNALYDNIEEVISANSPTMDQDSAVGDLVVRMSNSLETMDEDIFDQGRPPIVNDSA